MDPSTGSHPENPEPIEAEAVLVRQSFEPPGELAPIPGDAPAPLVIVQHRVPLWVWGILPGLLLGGVWAVIAYERYVVRAEVRAGETTAASRPAAGRGASAPDLASQPPEVVLKVQGLSPAELVQPELGAQAAAAGDTPTAEGVPTAAVADEPIAEAPAVRRLEAAGPVGFDRNAPAVPAGPEAPVPRVPGLVDAPDDTQVALADIQAEAQRRHQEKAELQAARRNPRAVAVERDQQAAAARRRALPLDVQADLDQREEFRRGLRQLLQTQGEDAAEAILGMARMHGADPAAALENRIAGDPRVKHLTGTGDRARRVQILRSHGLSEALILGDLVVVELQNARSGAGAHTRDQAILRAARQLLAIAPSPRTAAQASVRNTMPRTRDPGR